ncbi:PAS domain-containing sensor histidine kinase [Rhodococcus pyridinivorans]|uniref:histidine kinase n=3 Tax=Rhodococcus pyridinivorans TaxID=103816 RepID=V9XEV4_9NOCA|nr:MULTISPECIES: PAS domain-containing sensor histidine kinase [Rhodococcus]AHD20520.1 ATPase [Rhodococcus pyridinivorans SB3094]AWZ25871.1 ATPase [Rhodococcus pyridinivorans]EHK86322.1 two component system sensor kinase [Rhodococcus pyridinivorans AK37]MCD2118161.1 PAS domain-containing sensor histidine kinase [Rhodococcus pyridinivorans]MCD2139588.1 PAS domain-containing sensor histidine kinase [Rhodococcus pyridinivorans]
MSTLSSLLARYTDLPGAAVDHLQRVVGEWQLLADLSFADVLLWVDAAPSGIVCVAQCRPTTASTVIPEDAVGTLVSDNEHPYVRKAFETGEIVDVKSSPGAGINIRQAVPVRWDGRVVAVLSRDAARVSRRSASALETAYLECADDLYRMISEGTFPTPEARSDTKSSPRAGDGFIRLDRKGKVVYASPNALSAYHRMGLNSDLIGQDLVETTRALVTDPFESRDVTDYLRGAVEGRLGQRMEIEALGATVLIRALVLNPGGKIRGAAVIVRDVTEVKRRDRALLSKDATIREIHHRVKNNLQTVAALLRLQARRTGNAEAQQALGEAVRRVTSIALVHEALSMSVDEEVDLDGVFDQLIPIVVDVSTVGSQIRVVREGNLGVFPADRATPLVMVLTELVQNAVEHAFDPGVNGTVTVNAQRSARMLDVVVRDEGKGLPEGFSLEASNRLGLQIVRTLVAAELGGSLELTSNEVGGTDARLQLPLGKVPVA